MKAKSAAGRRDAEVLTKTGSVTAPKPVQVLVRMREPLKAALEDAARRKGVSTTAEIIDRLEHSFADQERFGGPEMLAMVNLMAGAFLRGGQLGARARGHPKWTPREWLGDPICHQVAVASVIDALGGDQPRSAEMADPEAMQKLFAGMIGRGYPIAAKTENEKRAPATSARVARSPGS
jgi:hypothetical protein